MTGYLPSDLSHPCQKLDSFDDNFYKFFKRKDVRESYVLLFEYNKKNVLYKKYTLIEQAENIQNFIKKNKKLNLFYNKNKNNSIYFILDENGDFLKKDLEFKNNLNIEGFPSPNFEIINAEKNENKFFIEYKNKTKNFVNQAPTTIIYNKVSELLKENPLNKSLSFWKAFYGISICEYESIRNIFLKYKTRKFIKLLIFLLLKLNKKKFANIFYNKIKNLFFIKKDILDLEMSLVNLKYNSYFKQINERTSFKNKYESKYLFSIKEAFNIEKINFQLNKNFLIKNEKQFANTTSITFVCSGIVQEDLRGLRYLKIFIEKNKNKKVIVFCNSDFNKYIDLFFDKNIIKINNLNLINKNLWLPIYSLPFFMKEKNIDSILKINSYKQKNIKNVGFSWNNNLFYSYLYKTDIDFHKKFYQNFKNFNELFSLFKNLNCFNFNFYNDLKQSEETHSLNAYKIPFIDENIDFDTKINFLKKMDLIITSDSKYIDLYLHLGIKVILLIPEQSSSFRWTYEDFNTNFELPSISIFHGKRGIISSQTIKIICDFILKHR